MTRYRLFVRSGSSGGGTGGGGLTFAAREALTIGTYEPDDTNTGLLGDPARTLTVRTGDLTVTAAGSTVADLEVRGRILVRADNVTIDNCWVRGPSTTGGGGGLIDVNTNTRNCLIRDCLIAPQTPSEGYDGIRSSGFIAKRCRVMKTTDALGVFPTVNGTPTGGLATNVQILGCWGGPQTRWFPATGQTDGTHNDGVQIQGGSGTVVRGNRFDGYFDPNSGNTGGLNRQSPQQTTTNACIQLNNNVGNTTGILVENNWLNGAEIGINGGSLAAAVTLGTFQNNRFDHGQTAGFLQGGTNSYTINISSTPTATITGNVYDDTGTAVTVRRP